MSKKRELFEVSKLKCANSECNEDVDALSMDDNGYCNDCHNKIIDGLVIEESEETKFLSDESLRIMCEHPIRVRPSRSPNNWRRKRM